MLFADTETHLITHDEPIPRLVVSAFEPGGLLLRDDLVLDALPPIAFANAAYDLLVWCRAYPDAIDPIIDALERGDVHDVLLREKMIDHAYGARSKGTSYSLAAVGERRANVHKDAEDPFRKLYGGLDGVPLELWPGGAKTYALGDARVLAPIYAEQEKHADVLTDEPRQVRASVALAAHGARGIATDTERVRTLDRLFAARRTELERKLLDAGLVRHKHKRKRPSPLVKSQKLAREMIVALAEETGQPYLRTDKGSPALSAEALDVLHVPEDHPLHAYRALGSLTSKRSTYLDPLWSPVVRTSYDPCVQTGRTSSYDPNLQNFPRDVLAWLPADRLPLIEPGVSYPDLRPLKPRPLGFRECLVARPAHVLVISDWSMMELVCLAQTCLDWFGWSALADALRDGRDPHEELGSTIAGFDIRGHAERKQWRTLAKAPNFGYPGGLGDERFVAWAAATYGIHITIKRAKELKEIWRRQWPEMIHYHRRIGTICASGSGTIRLDRTGYVRGGMGYTDAANFPFQGLAAAVAKDALWRCFVAHARGRLGAPVLFVHDEIVTECPEHLALEHAAEQERIMIGALAELCPDVPGGVETMITTCYTK